MSESIEELKKDLQQARAERDWSQHQVTCGQCRGQLGKYGPIPLCPEGNRLHTAVVDLYADAATSETAGAAPPELCASCGEGPDKHITICTSKGHMRRMPGVNAAAGVSLDYDPAPHKTLILSADHQAEPAEEVEMCWGCNCDGAPTATHECNAGDPVCRHNEPGGRWLASPSTMPGEE